eukprot:196490_1
MSLTQPEFEKLVARVFKTYTSKTSQLKAFQIELSEYTDKKQARQIAIEILKAKKHHSWNLVNYPYDTYFVPYMRPSNVMTCNKTTLIIATLFRKHWSTFPFGIYKYYTNYNKWKHKKYANNLQEFRRSPSIALNNSTNTLYLYHSGDLENSETDPVKDEEYQNKILKETRLLIFDLNSDNVDVINIGPAGYMDRTQMIFAQNHLHFFDHIPCHFIYDEKKKILVKQHSFQDVGCHDGGIVYVPSKRKIFHIGGSNSSSMFYTNCIFEYCLMNHIWRKCDIKLPIKMSPEACVLSTDEKYILIFGAWIVDEKDQDFDTKYINDIYIWNLETMKITKSIRCCPIFTCYGRKSVVVICNDCDKLIYGYLKQYCNAKKIPNDIMDLLRIWYQDDYVYLNASNDGLMYRIKMD